MERPVSDHDIYYTLMMVRTDGVGGDGPVALPHSARLMRRLRRGEHGAPQRQPQEDRGCVHCRRDDLW